MPLNQTPQNSNKRFSELTQDERTEFLKSHMTAVKTDSYSDILYKNKLHFSPYARDFVRDLFGGNHLVAYGLAGLGIITFWLHSKNGPETDWLVNLVIICYVFGVLARQNRSRRTNQLFLDLFKKQG